MSSGKHLICDIKNIKNLELLNSLDLLKNMFDDICNTYGWSKSDVLLLPTIDFLSSCMFFLFCFARIVSNCKYCCS